MDVAPLYGSIAANVAHALAECACLHGEISSGLLFAEVSEVHSTVVIFFAEELKSF